MKCDVIWDDLRLLSPNLNEVSKHQTQLAFQNYASTFGWNEFKFEIEIFLWGAFSLINLL